MLPEGLCRRELLRYSAVQALGYYVLPHHLRAYVMRVRWRLDAYDWTNTDRLAGLVVVFHHHHGAPDPH